MATPDFEFAIIAGGKNNDKGYNPLLRGDNDGAVPVETARLAGARDFAVLPILHTFIMNDKRVQEYTLRFLREGYFISDAERHSIDEN